MVAVIEGIAMDSSDACSVCSVASRKLGSTPPSLSNPDVVCYLSIASETQHANRFQSRSENVMAFYVE